MISAVANNDNEGELQVEGMPGYFLATKEPPGLEEKPKFWKDQVHHW